MTNPTVIEAPHEQLHRNNVPTIFLAGSIEMDRAERWQSRLIAALDGQDCTILNPRRQDWDTSFEQEKRDPQFREQVEWELQGLRDSDIIAMYLAPGTVSPISLLELGLNMHESLVLCCPPGFARKGNVDITAEFYGVHVWETWEEWVTAVRARVAALTGMLQVIR